MPGSGPGGYWQQFQPPKEAFTTLATKLGERWRDRELRADAFMTFQLNADGTIDRVKMGAVSPSTDFSFDFQDLDLRPAGR